MLKPVSDMNSGNIEGRMKTSIIKMEQHKISKLWSDSTVSKYVTRKWIVANDLPSGLCFVNNNIRFKTRMLRLICVTIVICILWKGQ